MIPVPQYKTRTHEQLLAGLKFAANELQMRDWEYDFTSGNQPPENLEMRRGEVGKCIYYIDNLKATIFVHLIRCQENNMDPLDVLFHEMWHIFLAYHGVSGDDDRIERMCNIGAILLMHLYTTKKGKK